MAFAAPALPFVQLGFSVVQAANQNAAGKYNQAVQNRNAQIAEQEAKKKQKEDERKYMEIEKAEKEARKRLRDIERAEKEARKK